VLQELVQATWKSKHVSGYQGEIRHAVNAVTLKNLMYLVSDNQASEQARAIAYANLNGLRSFAKKQITVTKDTGEKAALQFAIFQIDQFEANPEGFKRLEPLSPPDGSPIGTDLHCSH
jgi:hypothetical protein